MCHHSFPKTISPQSHKERRENNFIRIPLSLFGVPIKMGPPFPERGILIKVSAVLPEGLDSYYFPPSQGKIL